jgi:hypothetical protein
VAALVGQFDENLVVDEADDAKTFLDQLAPQFLGETRNKNTPETIFGGVGREPPGRPVNPAWGVPGRWRYREHSGKISGVAAGRRPGKKKAGLSNSG